MTLTELDETRSSNSFGFNFKPFPYSFLCFVLHFQFSVDHKKETETISERAE